MRAIGIDFGTTNCSATICHDGYLESIPLEDGRFILPSTICITREQEIFFGHEGIQLYLSLVGGTPIRYKFTDLREFTSYAFEEQLQDPIIHSGNPMVIVSSAGADEDLDTPARLFQSLKTGLRDPSFNGTTVYGRYYAIEELIALVLRHVRACAESYLGESVDATVIGRPVSYAPVEDSRRNGADIINRTAHERMLVAARLAGFSHAGLVREPVAAARHLAKTLPRNSHLLVFDFGGGTLDLALARVVDDHAPAIIATHGVHVGGDDLDSAIMGHSVLRYFGKDTTIGRKNLPFPENLLEPLLHWQTMPLLATPAHAAHIARTKRQSNAPHALANLQTLVRQGLGFRLFQLVEAAKIKLSDEQSALISMCDCGLCIHEEVTRRAFVDAIARHLATIDHALARLLEKAEMAPQDVDVVLMTGGSSLVPVVQQSIGRLFPTASVSVTDPFTSISAGLGIVAEQDDICVPLEGVVAKATEARKKAEEITIGARVTFRRGRQTVEGLVVRRAAGRLHDAILVIEFWDEEIKQFVSTMRHETKVARADRVSD